MHGNIVIAPSLFSRVAMAARANFESCEAFLATVIEAGLNSHRAGTVPDRVPTVRRRDGGKAPAKTLLRPVNASTKRGRVLSYFLHATGATVRGAMAEFDLSRPAVFAHWTTLNLVHGVGYAFDAASDAILVRLPCDEADVFGVASQNIAA